MLSILFSVTNSTVQSPSWEANRSSAKHEFPQIHNRLPPVPIPKHINPVHATPSHFSKVKFSIILPSTCRSLHQHPVCISPVPHTYQTNSLLLIWTSAWYLVSSTDHTGPNYEYVVCYSPLLPYPHFIPNGLIICHSITIWYDMIYFLTAIGLTPGGSSTHLHTSST